MEVDSKARVLVVDDDESVRLLMKRALTLKGVACDLASNGVEADKFLNTNQYGLMITDLRMPEKHGHKIATELLSQPFHPMIIVMTGVEDNRLFADLLERGVEDIILKPFSFELMAMKIRAMLAQAKKDREKEKTGGGSGAQQQQQVMKQLEGATSILRSQLSGIQESFKQTIEQLEKQRDDLEAGYLDSVRVLTRLTQQVTKHRESHVVRVEELAIEIGGRMDFDRNRLHVLKVATLLHEIGQFGMPDQIRSKPPWNLTGEELQAFRQYPIIGATLLSEIQGAEPIIQIIEQHAENYDGSGFPQRMKGDVIVLEARILRVADGIDTHRMHSSSADHKDAILQHLKAQRGKMYDPRVVDVTLNYLAGATIGTLDENVVTIPIEEAVDGMVLAEDLYDETGCLLVRSGAPMTRRLKDLIERFDCLRMIAVYAKK